MHVGEAVLGASISSCSREENVGPIGMPRTVGGVQVECACAALEPLCGWRASRPVANCWQSRQQHHGQQQKGRHSFPAGMLFFQQAGWPSEQVPYGAGWIPLLNKYHRGIQRPVPKFDRGGCPVPHLFPAGSPCA